MATRKTTYPIAPIRRLAKEKDVSLMSKESLGIAQDIAIDATKDIAEKALSFARHAHRKKVNKKDVALAVSHYGRKKGKYYLGD